LVNDPAVEFSKRDSDLAAIRTLAIPLDMTKRAKLLYNSEPFELAHKSVEQVQT
jgi:ubiquitin carboxyl-terminal hydrolase L3